MRDWNQFEVYAPLMVARFWSYLWGIETGIDRSSLYRKLKFWSYLWGIETKLVRQHDRRPNGFDLTYEGLKFPRSERTQFANCLFWSYLWGIEICQAKPLHKSSLQRFDLTYEGLKYGYIATVAEFGFVLILPMRDWNIFFFIKNISIVFRFDLTYEGLKSISK